MQSVYKPCDNSLLARTLFSKGNKFTNISEHFSQTFTNLQYPFHANSKMGLLFSGTFCFHWKYILCFQNIVTKDVVFTF